MILKSPLGLIKGGSFGKISLIDLSVNACLDNAPSKCSDQSVCDIKKTLSCSSTDVFSAPFFYEFGLEFHSYVEGCFVFSMHLAIVILNSPGKWGENRLLKDKVVKVNAVVTAECQLSYHGTAASYPL